MYYIYVVDIKFCPSKCYNKLLSDNLVHTCHFQSRNSVNTFFVKISTALLAVWKLGSIIETSIPFALRTWWLRTLYFLWLFKVHA